MQQVYLLVILFALASAGCVSRAKSDVKAREAFLEGQKQMQRQMQAPAKTVTVNGDVRNSIISWTEDLTLAKAIYAAEYTGFTDPKSIYVIHNGQAFEIKPNDLLRGRDFQLNPGDTVEIRH